MSLKQIGDINDLRAGQRSRHLVMAQSKTPIAAEDIGAKTMDFISVAAPLAMLAFFGASWMEASVIWGLCSIVAQLMHIKATLKANGVPPIHFSRSEGGTWQRER